MKAVCWTHGAEHMPARGMSSSGLWARASLHKSWCRFVIVAAVAAAHGTWGVPGFPLLNEPREFFSLNTRCFTARLRLSWLKL